MGHITVNVGDRTNNYCEAWNSRFETLVGHKSPSVWTTLEVLGTMLQKPLVLVSHGSGRLKTCHVEKSVKDFKHRLQ